MIYLIGGISRVGKSTLASMILERNKISAVSTDVIRNLLDFSPTKVGINDLEISKKPEAFFPYFSQLVHILNNKYSNYVVEGDLFTPEQVALLQKEIDLKCVFIGTSNITLEDLKKIDSKLDWVSKMPMEVQEKLPGKLVERSKTIETEAAKYGFQYFDISPDRNRALESAYNILLG